MFILLLLFLISLSLSEKCIILTKFIRKVSDSNVSLNNVKIHGGQPADITNFPHQVSVIVSGRHICGGSIISEIYIITSAACVDGENTQNTEVQVGSSTIKGSDGAICAIKAIYEHPKFSLWNYENDIAILELETKLKFSDKVNIIRLPKPTDDVPVTSEAIITGWGSKQSSGSANSDQLMYAIVPIMSLYKCLRYYPYGDVTNRMICAGYGDGRSDSCLGDSGGPLVVGDVLYGVVSWGYSCGKPDRPGVYTSVISMRDFISDVTGL